MYFSCASFSRDLSASKASLAFLLETSKSLRAFSNSLRINAWLFLIYSKRSFSSVLFRILLFKLVNSVSKDSNWDFNFSSFFLALSNFDFASCNSELALAKSLNNLIMSFFTCFAWLLSLAISALTLFISAFVEFKTDSLLSLASFALLNVWVAVLSLDGLFCSCFNSSSRFANSFSSAAFSFSIRVISDFAFSKLAFSSVVSLTSNNGRVFSDLAPHNLSNFS